MGDLNMDIKLTFSKEARRDVLELLDKSVDEDGFIVESDNPEQRVPTFDGEELCLKEFGGVESGSEVFIKNNLVSLMKIAKR